MHPFCEISLQPQRISLRSAWLSLRLFGHSLRSQKEASFSANVQEVSLVS
jgi:hypothetical protein